MDFLHVLILIILLISFSIDFPYFSQPEDFMQDYFMLVSSDSFMLRRGHKCKALNLSSVCMTFIIFIVLDFYRGENLSL